MVDLANQSSPGGAGALARNGASTEFWLSLLCASATIANAAADVETAARGIIERVCSDAGWSEGRVYLRLTDSQAAHDHWLVIVAGVPGVYGEGSECLTRQGPPAGSVAAQAIAEDRPCWWPGAGGGPDACALPIRDGGSVIGALMLQRPAGSAPLLPDELQVLQQIAAQLGLVQARVRLQRSALRQQQELALTGRLASMRELARNLAHEVNQPLAAVVSYAGGALQLLEQGRGEEAKLRRALEQIGVQAKRASGIILEFREFLRRQDTRHERLDVAALVHDAARLVQARAREAGVTIEFDLPPRLSPVVGDRVQLQQVLINLIENAVEAMAAAGSGERRLLISVVEDSQLEIRIRDSGVGMAPDLLPQLFTPFLTTKPHGLGMGLPISRSIVEFHGGRLSGENNPDGGMTFRVRLPAARGDG